MKYINKEFNEKNINLFRALCSEKENKFVTVESDGNGYCFGIIAMTKEEENLLNKIKNKCGVANSENAEYLSAKCAQTLDEHNYSSFLTRLDEKIEEKIKSSKVKIIKENGYFLFDKEDPKVWAYSNFCHHNEHEALYFYYLETMKLEDFWF